MIGMPVSIKEQSLLARHLAVTIKAGLTITEALSLAGRSSRRLRPVLKAVAASVAGGRRLSVALRDYPAFFPALLVSAVETGESSGTLGDNLAGVAAELEKESTLFAKLRGALIYPLTILVLTIVLGAILALTVFPKLLPLFSGLRIDLPWTTRWLLRLADLTRGTIWWWIGILTAGLFGLWWLIRQSFLKPVMHWLWLRLPLVGRLTRELNMGRLSRRVGLLLKSGVSADEALRLAGTASSNYYYQQASMAARDHLVAGNKLSASLRLYPDLFPELTTRMIEVGEETGELESSLFYLADFYEAEAERAIKTLPTIIEPLLLFVIGLVVAWFALSIITPIYELTSLPQR